MRHLGVKRLLVLAAAVLAAGCGKSSSSSSLDLQSFVAASADIVCSSLAKCGCTDPSAVASCKEAYASDMMDRLDSQLLQYPGQTVDPVVAEQCLQAAQAELSDCAPPARVASMPALLGMPSGFAYLPGCETTRIFKGMQAQGERCSADVECATGLACDDVTRSCVTAAAVTESCDGISCAPGLWCDGDYVCQPKIAAGDPCDYTDQCETGLTCRYSYSAEGDICTTLVADGGDCSDGIPCVAGDYCDGSNTCVPQLADGAECDGSAPCLHGWCNSEGVCENPGICRMQQD